MGAREPLDLSPERWELPMRLGDLFSAGPGQRRNSQNARAVDPLRHLLQPFLCVDADVEGSQSPAWQKCCEVGSQRVRQLHLRSVDSCASAFFARGRGPRTIV